jgi:hypothetical protein
MMLAAAFAVEWVLLAVGGVLTLGLAVFFFVVLRSGENKE